MALHHATELVVAGALAVRRSLGGALLEAFSEGILEWVKERLGRAPRSPKLSRLEAEAEQRRSRFWAETVAHGGRIVGPTVSTPARRGQDP